jgi:hypothetical protein
MNVDDPARPLTEADRAAAVSQLRRAAEDGRLSPHELDDRVARVRRARLVGELRSALDGLGPENASAATAVIWPSSAPSQTTPSQTTPTPTTPSQTTPTQTTPNQPAQAPRTGMVPQGPALPTPPGYRPDDRLTLSAGMSNEKRSGRWTIPPFVRTQAGFGKVKLDCRHAQPAAAVIDIEVGVGADNVVIIVPPGWGVDTDRLGKGIGTIKVKVPRDAAPGCPTLVFHGALGMSTLVVRTENWVERRLDKS